MKNRKKKEDAHKEDAFSMKHDEARVYAPHNMDVKETQAQIQDQKECLNLAHTVHELIEAVADELKSEQLEALDAFEKYTQKIRSKLYVDVEQARMHFVKGYQVLLKEILYEQKKST